jgi:hypothetical protein
MGEICMDKLKGLLKKEPYFALTGAKCSDGLTIPEARKFQMFAGKGVVRCRYRLSGCGRR